MAIVNGLFGKMRGKYGGGVYAVVKGQNILREYNPQPGNPRSYAQQAQRALLANMTKFYKRGSQNFFRFAFEDKLTRESDFNAFARKNMQRGVYMPKELYDNVGVPALGNYMIADGRIATNIADFFSGENYGILLPAGAAITTLGELSAAIIAQSPNVVEGDIFTMVMADSEFTADMTPGTTAPTWQIIQFFIDPSDLRPLSAVGLAQQTLPTGTTGRFIGVDIIGVDRASFGAVVISRNTESGLLVSRSETKGSAVANVLVDWLRGEYMRRVCAASWGGNPDAVLQGGYLATLPQVTGIQFSPTGTILATYAYGTVIYNYSGADSSTITLAGSNMRTTAQGGRYVIKYYPADVLGTQLNTTPVFTIEYSANGTDTSITLTRPSNMPSIGSQYYMLVEVDGVPVWYGLGLTS